MTNKLERILKNFIRMSQGLARGDVFFKHNPSYIEFAWTNACNLRCEMCEHSEEFKTEKVSKEIAAPFLDCVLPGATFWMPSAGGEPFLYKEDVDEIIKLCTLHEVFLSLNTNATLLTPETFDKLSPWFHRLVLSIDCHVPEVLEKVRSPIKYENVFPNIRYAVKRSNELQIQCHFNSVFMKDTVIHYPEFVDWVADLGGQSIEVSELHSGSKRSPELNAVNALGIERVKELLHQMRHRAEKRGVNLYFGLPAEMEGGAYDYKHFTERMTLATVVAQMQHWLSKEMPGFCPQIGYYFTVNPKGDAYPCCAAPDELLLGNVFEQSFVDVWNGKAAQQLRAAHYKNDFPAPCENCIYRKITELS